MVGNKNTLPAPYEYNGGQQKYVTGPLRLIYGGQQKYVTHPTREWWATKTRYPPYEYGNGGQQKHVTHPTSMGNCEQQKPVGSPTSTMLGNNNTLPTLQSISNLKEF